MAARPCRREAECAAWRRARRRPDSRRPAHRVFSIWPVMACRHRESTAPEPSKICAMWWAHLKLRHGIPTGSRRDTDAVLAAMSVTNSYRSPRYADLVRSEEHTTELQSLMSISYD